MRPSELITEISRPDYNLKAFVDLVLADPEARRACLEGMLRHPHIMIYDHCFYVTAGASRAAPELFYPHWDEIAALLDHPNSYHRDYGLTVLANLLPADAAGRFSAVFPAYLARIRDAKFMTADCCVRNLKRVLACRPDLTGAVLAALLAMEADTRFTPGQMALLKCSILEVIEQAYAGLPDRGAVEAFIRAAAGCPSPKTRAKARELIRRFGLAEARREKPTKVDPHS